MNIYEFINAISSGALDEQFGMLYGRNERSILKQRARYLSAAENYSRLYPEATEIGVFSASGRTEIGGNHTDHQNGCILAAAVDLDIIAIASLNDEAVIRIKSEGHSSYETALEELSPVDSERETTEALIRGIASGFSEKGYEIGGFNAYAASDIPVGSGISSSAAFEVLIGTIINSLYNNGSVAAEELARIGQFAENEFFGKKSGIMDQLVSSVGGFVFADLASPVSPKIKTVDLDLGALGYSLCITDTGEDHSGLSDEYSEITAEMKHTAAELGCEVLREADEDKFYEELPELRKKCGDRELLRAAHFFDENRRVCEMAEALENGDTEEFFALVNASGASSAELLQNLYSVSSPQKQSVPLAIMMSKRYLRGSGAVRVHGGGFGGTILAFVPTYTAGDYAAEMDRLFGDGACRIFNIRPVGGYEIKI